MVLSDIIGTIGVILMLSVFVLNIADRLHNDSPFYIVPNLIGSGMACAASVMINYLPFVILEGTWCIVSVWAFFVYLQSIKKKRYGKHS